MAGGSLIVSDQVEAQFAADLDRLAPERQRLIVADATPEGDLSSIEIAFFSGDLFPDRTRHLARALAKSEALAWLHSFSAGVDHPWFQNLLQRGVRITTSSGASAVPIAHTVVLYLLALSRNLEGWLDDQRHQRWNERPVTDLQGQRLGVVGLGPIGLEVARLGVALGMHVTGVRRNPRGDEPCETWSLDRLPDLLPLVDALVLALPLTDETRHLIDARALARMKPEARLINVGRGSLVDEKALVDALEQGRLAGAGLDVFEVEPLPESSPLWRLPNVIITPHSAGTNPGNNQRAIQIFLDNLERYEKGEELRNEVSLPPT